MSQTEQKILELSKVYFDMHDEDINDDVLLLMVSSLIDYYKTLRCYPANYTDEMIEADVSRYFETRKTDVAMSLIPEMYGRIGAEGLSMLTDAGTSRFFAKSTLFHDVAPICEVI